MFFKKKLDLNEEIERYGDAVCRASDHFCQALADKHPTLPKEIGDTLETDLMGYHLIIFRKRCIKRGMNASIYNAAIDRLMTVMTDITYGVAEDHALRNEAKKALKEALVSHIKAFGNRPSFYDLTDRDRQDIEKVVGTLEVAQTQKVRLVTGESMDVIGDILKDISDYLMGIPGRTTDTERLLSALEQGR